jgi:hypothetical protein
VVDAVKKDRAATPENTPKGTERWGRLKPAYGPAWRKKWVIGMNHFLLWEITETFRFAPATRYDVRAY